MAFADYLSDACTLAGVGFHFEEGGCFAMALALRDAFADDMVEGRLAFDVRAFHAYFETGGAHYDHQGESWAKVTVEYLDEEAFLARAAGCGASGDALASDRETAAEIVASARELESAHESAKAAITANTGLDEREADDLIEHMRRNAGNIDFMSADLRSEWKFAALEAGLARGRDDFLVNGETLAAFRSAFSRQGGGEYLRDFVVSAAERGLWPAILEIGSSPASGSTPPRVR